MRLVICPGIHHRSLTQSFLEQVVEPIASQFCQTIVFPTDRYPAFSGPQILQVLQEQVTTDDSGVPLVLIGFSAGVVGAIAAAWGWQSLGRKVQALIALDGWGVPLAGNFPIHRCSHDYFTHWSSALLGAGADSFYADPAVEHLDLWRSPQTAAGWRVTSSLRGAAQRTTAANFLTDLLCAYSKSA